LLSGSLFKKKKKKTETKEPITNDTLSVSNANTIDGSVNNSKPKGNTNSNKAINATGKFDFIAGEKVLYFDDFARVNIGDFPADINTNATGEIVNIEGREGKWLRMSKNGAFVPDYTQKLPENCTIEFEVAITGEPSNNYAGFGLNFTTQQDDIMKESFFSKGTSIVYLHPGASLASVFVNPISSNEISNDINMPQWSVENGNTTVKVAVWRQKGRLRVYLNEDKIIDMPRFFSEPANYSFAFFRNFFNECNIYLKNFKLAIAAADNRNKLITEGRFTTNEILFDINSDKIKPESNSILSDIGKILAENSNVRVKIIGHTDSDGDGTSNITLSKKRAEAVKMRLVYGFGIEEARIETDGKGATIPLNNNKTPEEKALNRRVEFIKL